MLEHGVAAKRASPRLGIQVPVEFANLKDFKTARSLDVSARGMFLRTNQVYPVGEDVVLRFSLPGVARPFKAVGRVTWSSPTDTPQGYARRYGCPIPGPGQPGAGGDRTVRRRTAAGSHLGQPEGQRRVIGAANGPSGPF
ncbi:MAG: PilZ domain-containing protein [Candidatus Moduliflexus flocculans]|nr:PilZ domain-containing protein [Candidatus Moduliflexus flocculans]